MFWWCNARVPSWKRWCVYIYAFLSILKVSIHCSAYVSNKPHSSIHISASRVLESARAISRHRRHRRSLGAPFAGVGAKLSSKIINTVCCFCCGTCDASCVQNCLGYYFQPRGGEGGRKGVRHNKFLPGAPDELETALESAPRLSPHWNATS